MKIFALKDSTDPDSSVLAILCYYENADEYSAQWCFGESADKLPHLVSRDELQCFTHEFDAVKEQRNSSGYVEECLNVHIVSSL